MKFSDHELRGFGIFHKYKIVFILLDQNIFETVCDFQLIALLKSGIEVEVRKLVVPAVSFKLNSRYVYSTVLFL